MATKKGIEHICTPVFTPEMGKRLALARMKLNLDQAQLAKLWGVSQQRVSKVELGRLDVIPELTVARFEAVMGKFSRFVLFGTDSDRFQNPGTIVRAYWKGRLARVHARGLRDA